ncbi:MAG: hypothetical protein KF691_08605 [Phycisphaeraceae bacterium]|nr:hypothetical protein [Phycisphaeraceae bacterium]
MNAIRNILKNPVVGWSLAGIAIIFAAWTFIRSLTARSPYDPARMTENVTIRYMDTGEEVQMPRGRFEKELRSVGRALKPDEGVINPKTGKPTGVLVAAAEWKETVERLNAERQMVKENSPFGPASNAAASTPKTSGLR